MKLTVSIYYEIIIEILCVEVKKIIQILGWQLKEALQLKKNNGNKTIIIYFLNNIVRNYFQRRYIGKHKWDRH